MIGSGKVIRVGGFNLNTICSSLLGNRQGGLSPIFKALFAGSERGFAYDPSDLTAAKAAFRRNLLTETEFRNGISDIHVKGGSYSATTFEGLTQGTGIRVDTNVGGTYIYKTFAHTVNVPYVFSCYVRTLDGSAPVLGDQSNDASADFVLVGKGSAIYNPYKSIVHLGNGLYRAIAVITNSSTTPSFGIVKYAGNSTKPIVVSGYQLEQASTVSAYQALTDFNAEFMAQFPTHTLFQDVAGTIPVYAANQPVGLVLDKSKGLTLSSELFNTALDFNNWSRTAAVTSFTANSFTTNGIGGCTKNPFFAGISIYKTYSVRVVGTTTAPLNVRGSGSIVGQVTIPVGNFDVTLRSNATLDGGTIYLQLAAAGTVTFNLISVKEILGNHASQTTTAARPMLRQTPILGFEHITNGSFTTDTSGWSPSTSTTIASVGGSARVTATAAVNATMLRMLPNLAGRTVDVSVKFANRTGGTGVAVLIWSQGTNFTAGSAVSVSSEGTLNFRATMPNDFVGGIYLRLDGATAGQYVDFDDITVRDITGYTTDRNTFEFDGIDDQLTTVLGTPITGCTVLRAVPNIGTEIRYNQTIPMGYADMRTHAGLVAINRNLSSYELVKLAVELDKKVGVKSLDTALVQTFSNNEQGFAYDPNDLTTLFQDSTGNTPVTAAGQPVGLVLDKSKGLKIGSELFTQFNSTLNSTVSQNTLPCVVTSTVSVGVFGVAAANLFQEGLYKIEFTWSGNTSQADMGVQLPNGNNLSLGTGVTGSFSKVMNFTSTGSFSITKSAPQVGQTFTVSAVSVKKIAGNHAFQTVSTSRPVIRQTPTLGSELVVNGDFNNGLTGWAASNAAIITNVNNALVVTSTDVANAQARQAGTVAAGKTVECSVNFKSKTGASSYVRLALYSVATGNVGVADSLISSTSGTLTFTAQVPSNFTGNVILQLGGAVSGDSVEFDDVSMKEVLGYRTDQNYLEFDGVDDFLITSNINFTTTNKVSLFAGIRKVQNSSGMLVELGSNNINSKFYMTNEYVFISRGDVPYTTGKRAEKIVSQAPVSAVMSASGNIQTSVNKLRINGVAGTQNTEALGAGNFSNAPLYIGRREGTTIPFNGKLYGLIGVGRLTSETEVLAIEQILAKRTGVTLSV